MSFSSYTAFRTNVSTWLDASDLPSAVIDDIITLAEKRVHREVRTREMETAFASTISSGVVTVPSDYGEMKYAYIDGTPTKRLTRASPEYIYEYGPTRSSDSKPKYFSREAGNFIFAPYPDSGYVMKGVYYKKYAGLSTALNDLFNASPDLYLWACLVEAERVLGRDKRIGTWESNYQNAKNKINGEMENEAMSGGVETGRV